MTRLAGAIRPSGLKHEATKSTEDARRAGWEQASPMSFVRLGVLGASVLQSAWKAGVDPCPAGGYGQDFGMVAQRAPVK